MVRTGTIIALMLLVAGCGGAGDEDKAEAGKVAEDYVHAVAKGDFATACAQRTADERQQMAELAGSCEKGLTKSLGGKDAHVALQSEFGTLEAAKVTIDGDKATVELKQPGAEKAAFTLSEVRDGGAWRLTSAGD